MSVPAVGWKEVIFLLGAWISSSKKGFSTMRAWDKASLQERLKLVSILQRWSQMYRSESWTLMEAMTKRLDGLYTRLLTFTVSWRYK